MCLEVGFQFARALLINTLFDVAIIAALLYLGDELSGPGIFFGWLILLAGRAVLGIRSSLLRLLEHWLFRSERLERLTAALRVAGVSKDYEIVPEFEALAQSVTRDDDAGPKAKQLISELVGYAQCATETGPLRGLMFRSVLDAAVRRHLA